MFYFLYRWFKEFNKPLTREQLKKLFEKKNKKSTD